MSVVLYLGKNFTGRAVTASGDISWIEIIQVPNDSVNSIKVENGYKVEIFSDKGYTGRNAILYTDVPDLSKYQFENSISSIKISYIGKNSYQNDFPTYKFLNDNPIGKILNGVLLGGLSGAGEAVGRNIKIGTSDSDLNQPTSEFLGGLKRGFLNKPSIQIGLIALLSITGLLLFKPTKKWLSNILK